jgi:hypothetical protein
MWEHGSLKRSEIDGGLAAARLTQPEMLAQSESALHGGPRSPGMHCVPGAGAGPGVGEPHLCMQAVAGEPAAVRTHELARTHACTAGAASAANGETGAVCCVATCGATYGENGVT